MGIYQDSIRHRDYYQLTSGILESETGELDFSQSLIEMKLDFFLELEAYELRFYQDSVRQIHYYQLTNVILESEIEDLGFEKRKR